MGTEGSEEFLRGRTGGNQPGEFFLDQFRKDEESWDSQEHRDRYYLLQNDLIRAVAWRTPQFW